MAYTPTHTTEHDTPSRSSSPNTQDSMTLCAPVEGRIYMIRHRQSGKVISLKFGIIVVDVSNQLSGRFWKCLETDGYQGFRETGSNRVLGHNGKNGLRATVDHHREWEHFVIRHKGNEGYHLQSRHGGSLKWVGIGSDGHTLVTAESYDKAAIWEFVEV